MSQYRIVYRPWIKGPHRYFAQEKRLGLFWVDLPRISYIEGENPSHSPDLVEKFITMITPVDKTEKVIKVIDI